MTQLQYHLKVILLRKWDYVNRFEAIKYLSSNYRYLGITIEDCKAAYKKAYEL